MDQKLLTILRSICSEYKKTHGASSRHLNEFEITAFHLLEWNVEGIHTMSSEGEVKSNLVEPLVELAHLKYLTSTSILKYSLTEAGWNEGKMGRCQRFVRFLKNNDSSLSLATSLLALIISIIALFK